LDIEERESSIEEEEEDSLVESPKGRVTTVSGEEKSLGRSIIISRGGVNYEGIL